MDWYLTAAEQGHAHAQYNIGLLLYAVKSVECMVNELHRENCVQDDDDSVQDNGDPELGGDDASPRDKDKAFEWLLKAAHQGLADAQIAVAWLMFIDSDLQAKPDSTSLSASIGWARKAADQGNLIAIGFMLATYLRRIEPEDRPQVFELHFKTQFNQTGGHAEYVLGSFFKDRNILHNDSRAFEFFVKGAEQGSDLAQYEVARCYEEGRGISTNYKKAIDWYTKASQKGHRKAKRDLGQLTAKLERLSVSDSTGLCVGVFYSVVKSPTKQQQRKRMLSRDDTLNHVQAFRHVHKSQKPSTSASLDSSDLIFIDCHTDPKTHKDFVLWADIQQEFDKALLVTHKTKMLPFLKGPDYQTNFDQANPDQTWKSAIIGWARKAAEQNHTVAQGFMRAVYVGGIDDPKARSQVFELLFKEGINRSGGSAECGMGWLYKSGGVLLDDLTAFEWFVKGAEQGSDMAQYEVARCYEEGRGVSTNYEKAVDWYTKASQKGHHQAKRDLDRLTAKLEGLSVGDATV
ncbi:MAG: hypothetical protein J3R72DRAFT_479877 [Linnemannia gamsii]|nr:MAG: hypothetical protein J3R72DRAFT_479877 [Linnemannia gamsii]